MLHQLKLVASCRRLKSGQALHSQGQYIYRRIMVTIKIQIAAQTMKCTIRQLKLLPRTANYPGINLLLFFWLSLRDIICKLLSQCKPQTLEWFKGIMWSTVISSFLACLYIAAILFMSAHRGIHKDPFLLINLWYRRCCLRCSGFFVKPPFQLGLFVPDIFFSLRRSFFGHFQCLPSAPDGFPVRRCEALFFSARVQT